jgi:hypothetical protein
MYINSIGFFITNQPISSGYCFAHPEADEFGAERNRGERNGKGKRTVGELFRGG